jgi:hypothetical protein
MKQFLVLLVVLVMFSSAVHAQDEQDPLMEELMNEATWSGCLSTEVNEFAAFTQEFTVDYLRVGSINDGNFNSVIYNVVNKAVQGVEQFSSSCLPIRYFSQQIVLAAFAFPTSILLTATNNSAANSIQQYSSNLSGAIGDMAAWAALRLGNEGDLINSIQLSSDNLLMYARSDGVTVRSCPRTSCVVITNLLRNEAVTVTDYVEGETVERSNMWREVRLSDGRMGYVHESLLTINPT